MLYPPVTRFIQLKISGKGRAGVRSQAQAMGEQCRRLSVRRAGDGHPVEVMGPIEAPMTRIAGRYRWQILLKSGSTTSLHRLVGALRTECAQFFSRRDVRVAVDVDPLFMQ